MPSRTTVCAVLGAATAAVLGIALAVVHAPIDFVPVDLSGQVWIVTGASDGIGVPTAETLACWGARVITPVRNRGKADAAVASMDPACRKNIEIYEGLDLLRLQSVREFVDHVEKRGLAVAGLINNAGFALTLPEVDPADGIDKMFKGNHVASAMLSVLLLPALERGAAQRGGTPSRIVTVSSMAHYAGHFDPAVFSAANKGVVPPRVVPGMEQYNTAKLFNIMFANELEARLAASSRLAGRVHVTTAHPGYVISNLDHSATGIIAPIAAAFRSAVARNTREGAVTQVTAATHPDLRDVGGVYFEDRCISNLCTSCIYCDSSNKYGVTPHWQARDAVSKKQLWDATVELAGLQAEVAKLELGK